MPTGIYKRKPRAPEHCANLSKSMKNSEAAKAAGEALRGVPRSPEDCAAMRVPKSPRTPEHSAALSKAGLDVPNTSEHNAAISAGCKNSEAVKAATDVMRGGDDICDHHYIYDHNDPDQHVVKITRSQHTSHHAWMRRNGLKVPHYNVTGENKDIFK